MFSRENIFHPVTIAFMALVVALIVFTLMCAVMSPYVVHAFIIFPYYFILVVICLGMALRRREKQGIDDPFPDF